MLGLCATSGADAAVASQGYVDAKVGVNTQSITELTGDVTDLQTQVGEGTVDSRIETAKQAAIDAAAADATTKANKALEDAKADAEKYIDETELTTSQSAQNTAIETAYKAADKVITDSIGTVPADKTVVGMIAEAQTAATYDDTAVKADIAKNAGAIATLNGDDQTEGSVAYQVKELADGAVATNTAAIETLNGNEQTAGSVAYQVKALEDGAVATNTAAIATLNGDAQTAGSVAKSIADEFTKANLSQYAIKSEVDGALLLYTKTSELGKLAKKDTVGTDDIDNLAVTTGKLANGAVTNDKISDVASSKVTGLSESLATKMDITNTTTVAGKYVFTANVGENGVTDYAWEEIARD